MHVQPVRYGAAASAGGQRNLKHARPARPGAAALPTGLLITSPSSWRRAKSIENNLTRRPDRGLFLSTLIPLALASSPPLSSPLHVPRGLLLTDHTSDQWCIQALSRRPSHPPTSPQTRSPPRQHTTPAEPSPQPPLWPLASDQTSSADHRHARSHAHSLSLLLTLTLARD